MRLGKSPTHGGIGPFNLLLLNLSVPCDFQIMVERESMRKKEGE